MSLIKILLADDHPMLRQGIRHRLEQEPDLEVAGEAGDGEEAIRMARELTPDVIIIDIGMPKINGLEATKQIKAENPAISILVLSVHDEEEYIIGVLEAGASGYLLKSSYGEELVNAVRSVGTGEFVLHPAVFQRLFARARNRQLNPALPVKLEKLTPRESEVLQLVARGMSNKGIALNLGIGLRTVKGHLLNIYAKMGVSSRTEAVLSALREGRINLEDTAQEAS